MLIKCTASPSQNIKEPLENAKIAYTVETTKQMRDLFCYVGTDIFVQGYIVNHQNPERPSPWFEQKELPDNLKYGSTYVILIEGEWMFSGDFQHCPAEDLRHNAKVLRAKLEELRIKHPKAKLYSLHKDYDGGCYLGSHLKKPKLTVEFGANCHVSQHSLEILQKHNDFHDWSQLLSYEEENTYRTRRIAEYKKEMERHVEEVKCPICANREYLESLGELKPEVTGDKNLDYKLAMNFEYFHGEDVYAKNWIVLKNKWEIEHTPKCKKCGKPNFQSTYFGCDSWVKDIDKGLCRDCDPEFQRMMREMDHERKQSMSKQERQKEALNQTAKLTSFT